MAVSQNNDVSAGTAAATTFPQLIRAAAAAYGEDMAITLTGDTIPSDSATFRELDERTALLARGLVARGVGKGTRVGFIFGNSPNFAVMLGAVARIGAIAIPISTLIKSNELVRVLRQSDVSGLIVQRSLLGHDLVERLCEALPDLRTSGPSLRLERTPYLRWIVSTGQDLPAAVQDMDSLTGAAAASVSEAMLREIEAEVHPSDQVVEIYTSGSMALPKGVKHTQGAVLFRTHYMQGALSVERGKEVGAPLPMFWVGGLMMYLMPNWAAGAITTCTEGTSTSSRMAMGSVLADEDMAMLGMKPPFWGLGMSETLGPYSYGDIVRVPGRPLCAPMDHFADRYDVRVADVNDQPVGDGGTGEVQVRGFAVTTGLHKLDRAGFFTADGYYKTGDMGLVEGSRVHFIGRDGDMIKTSGSNVSPAEVEMEMQALSGIHSAYVVGLPDDERGQVVAAAVVLRDGMTVDFAQVQAELRSKLSSYKVPRLFCAITRDEVPMLPSNKVARRQIVTLLQEKLLK